MSKKEKIYSKAKASPNNISFDDLCSLAEDVGFIKRKSSSGSHRIYSHPEIRQSIMNFQRPSSGKAKPYQVRQLLSFIDENNLLGG